MTGRPNFDLELEELHLELIKMGSLIEEAIEHSIKALKAQDRNLAKEIIDKDEAIDQMEKTIETKCLSIILRQQPVAKDLRTVSTALKMVTDMERIGDHASDIAEIVLMEKVHPFLDQFEHIPKMAQVAKEMVFASINAFIHQDIEAAKQIMKRDDEVDHLFDLVKLEIVQLLKLSTDYSDMCIDFLMIAKYFERIGDHVVNICEWIEFNQTGQYKNTRMI